MRTAVRGGFRIRREEDDVVEEERETEVKDGGDPVGWVRPDFVLSIAFRCERDYFCENLKTKGRTHEVLEHVSQFAHAGNVILPDVPDPVEEQLPRRGRRDVFARGGTRSCLTGTGRSDRVGGLREHGDDLFARLGLEVGRDEFGNSVVEEVALQRHTVRVVRDSGTLSLPYVAPCSTGLAYLFVQDEVVSVAVVFFERELRNVVPLDLLNRLLQPVERRINRFGLLRIVIPWSAFKTSPFSRTSAP